MKASTRKRLQALEQAVEVEQVRPVVIIDVTKLPAAEREAYWAGDETVLRKYGAPDPVECPPGQIHTIVVDVHPAARERWPMDTDREDDAAAGA
jgi:hypothetical protein